MNWTEVGPKIWNRSRRLYVDHFFDELVVDKNNPKQPALSDLRKSARAGLEPATFLLTDVDGKNLSAASGDASNPLSPGVSIEQGLILFT